MIGASLLKVIKFFIDGNAFSVNEFMILLTGTVISFAISIFVVSFLLKYIKKNDFKVFGWYRIFLGVILILLVII